MLGGEARLFDIWNCWVRDWWAAVSMHCLLPLRLLLGLLFMQVQSSCGVLRIVKGAEEGGCLN